MKETLSGIGLKIMISISIFSTEVEILIFSIGSSHIFFSKIVILYSSSAVIVAFNFFGKNISIVSKSGISVMFGVGG